MALNSDELRNDDHRMENESKEEAKRSFSGEEMLRRYRERRHVKEGSAEAEAETAIGGKGSRLASMIKDAKERASKLAENAGRTVVNALDRNDDGKLDLKDLSTIASSMEEKREKDRIEKELNSLKPIFEETITSPEFILPKLIRVAEIDRKHSESPLCKNSVGFRSEHEDIQIITIYPEQAAHFGLEFYPNKDSEIYYVDPCNRDCYIALDEYFKYLRLAKVNELQMIAQSLGAKHFKVTYVEQNSADHSDNAEAKVKVKVPGKGDFVNEAEHSMNSREFRKVEVAAEMDCLGHEPVEPTLVYLKSDPNIEAMVKMRMSKNAPIHQKVSVSLMSASGIKVKDAAKIDDALQALHFNANVSIQRDAKSEDRTILEYEIDY